MEGIDLSFVNSSLEEILSGLILIERLREETAGSGIVIETDDNSEAPDLVARSEVYSAIDNLAVPYKITALKEALDRRFPCHVWDGEVPYMQVLSYLWNERKEDFLENYRSDE
jgi:hypothetical protein